MIATLRLNAQARRSTSIHSFYMKPITKVTKVHIMENQKFPLNRTWSLWEMWDQNINSGDDSAYKNRMKEISTFNSLTSFWQHWHVLPHADPKQIFTDMPQKMRRTYGGIKIDSVGIFVEGVEPAWEDPANKTGCDIYAKIQVSVDVLKDIWDRFVFGVIGETIPHSEVITGVRIVEKLRGVTKIELWLSCGLGPVADEIRTYFDRELLCCRADAPGVAISAHYKASKS